jgi:hypothetical protein
MPPTTRKAAEPKTLTFTYDGTEYTVAADFPDSLSFHEHIEDGHYVLLARDLLGPRQWRTFQSKPGREHLHALELVNAWSDAAGLGK